MHPYLFFYLIGGLTFLPTLGLLVLFYLWIQLPTSVEPLATPSSSDSSAVKPKRSLTSPFSFKKEKEPLTDSVTGTSTLSPPSIPNSNSSSTSVAPTTSLDNVRMQADPDLNRSGYMRVSHVPHIAPASESLTETMTSILFSSSSSTKQRPKDAFFAVLRYDTLFLYDSDQQRECRSVVKMNQRDVFIFPRNLPDNEVFNKEHPIMLKRRQQHHAGDDEGLASLVNNTNNEQEYYLFVHSPVIKEDWYIALLHASKLPAPGTTSRVRDKAQFDQEAMSNLVSTIHSDEHHEQTRWFNALTGRIFLGIYRTQKIEEHFVRKIMKKTLKLKRPQFLEEIKVKQLDVGHSVPFITRTKLHSLLPNGEMVSEFHLDYTGGARIVIETGVSLSIGIKPYTIKVVLAVHIKSIRGMMLLKIKPPPSNRFWIGFQKAPELDMVIEPIFAEKAVKWSLVTDTIASKIREAIQETIVMPNMDDFPFSDSMGKGGVFEGDEEIALDLPQTSSSTSSPTTTAVDKMYEDSPKAFGSLSVGSRKSSVSEVGGPGFHPHHHHIHELHYRHSHKSRRDSIDSTLSSSDLDLDSHSAVSPPPPPVLASAPSNDSLSARIKRFSANRFSKQSNASTDSLTVEPAKLNTKPTVATSIATASRTSASGSPMGSFLSSKFPKLASTLQEANNSIHGIHVNTTNNTISNGQQHQANLLRQQQQQNQQNPSSPILKTLNKKAVESTGSGENFNSNGSDDLDTGSVAVPRAASRRANRSEFDTFPKGTMSIRKRANLSNGTNANGTNDGTSAGVSRAKTSVGIAGILHGADESESTITRIKPSATIAGSTATGAMGTTTTTTATTSATETTAASSSNNDADMSAVRGAESEPRSLGTMVNTNGLIGSRLGLSGSSTTSLVGTSQQHEDKQASLASFGPTNLTISTKLPFDGRASSDIDFSASPMSSSTPKDSKQPEHSPPTSNSNSPNSGTTPTVTSSRSGLLNGFRSRSNSRSNGSTQNEPSPPSPVHSFNHHSNQQQQYGSYYLSSSSSSSHGRKGSRSDTKDYYNTNTSSSLSKQSSGITTSSSASSSSSSYSAAGTSFQMLAHQKSQNIIAGTKAWVKRSIEDRRNSDDDPLLAGRMLE